MNSNYMVQMEHIDKTFGEVKANQDVSLHIKQGEIRALLGENGAGKTTLMKILYGLYTYDTGSIVIDGKTMPEKYTPSEAIGAGVALVPQHVQMVEVFTAAENILLGKEDAAKQNGLLSHKKEREAILSLCDTYHLQINPDRVVQTMSLGEKQRIEILKALYRNSKVLILDEPTAVLTPQEIESLFSLLREFKKKGITIIVVAHKLQEVMEMADRITVLRHGAKVKTLNKSEASIPLLADLMVGHDFEQRDVKPEEIKEKDVPIVELSEIETNSNNEQCCLKGLNLKLYPGRIIGVAGIDGNGQSDLAEVVAGLQKPKSGEVKVDGTTIAYKEMKNMGIGIIPEDRHKQGLILPLTVEQNLILRRRKEKRFSKKGVLRSQNIRGYANELLEKYDIRPRNKQLPAHMLSGGNQQKVILARELDPPDLRVTIADQPTRGLDVGAQDFVYTQLIRLKKQGVAVLLISSDLDEIYELSDYIAVIHDGRIVRFDKADCMTRNEIGLYMGGEKAGGEAS